MCVHCADPVHPRMGRATSYAAKRQPLAPSFPCHKAFHVMQEAGQNWDADMGLTFWHMASYSSLASSYMAPLPHALMRVLYVISVGRRRTPPAACRRC